MAVPAEALLAPGERPYVRRRPDRSVLHRVLRRHLNTFARRARGPRATAPEVRHRRAPGPSGMRWPRERGAPVRFTTGDASGTLRIEGDAPQVVTIEPSSPT